MPIVLCIDDRSANLKFLELILDRANIQSISASTGTEGIELARQYKPQLILLDLLMPENTLSGFQVATSIKNDPDLWEIPIIAISAADFKGRALEAGCDYFFRSPYQPNELIAVIQQYL